MDQHLMLDWLERVVKPYSIQIGKPLLLIMDEFEAHMTPGVRDKIKADGHTLLLVPARSTSYLQPCDVGINKPFKDHMKGQYEEWFDPDNCPKTAKGNMKKASFDNILDWVHNSLQSIDCSSMVRAFEACGISKSRSFDKLNSNLKIFLSSCSEYNNTKSILTDEEMWDSDNELVKANDDELLIEEISSIERALLLN